MPARRSTPSSSRASAVSPSRRFTFTRAGSAVVRTTPAQPTILRHKAALGSQLTRREHMATSSEKTSEKTAHEDLGHQRHQGDRKADAKDAAAAAPARDRDPARDKAIDLGRLARSRSSSARARSCGSARRRRPPRSQVDPDRLARPRHRARRRRPAARPHRRDLRPGVVRQDDAHAARHRRGAEAGGVCAFIDAEHALDVGYARKLGVRDRRPARLAARLRRAGAGDRRDARPLGRGRRHRRRLGRGARAARPRSRARWATRTSACRRAS